MQDQLRSYIIEYSICKVLVWPLHSIVPTPLLFLLFNIVAYRSFLYERGLRDENFYL